MIFFKDDKTVSKIRSDGEYCCNEMKDTMECQKYDMYYDKKFSQTLCERRDGGVKWYWDYCPFCGKCIKSKAKQYEKVIFDEFKINTKDENFDWNTLDQLLPAEFRSDEWWKNRGL